MQSLQKLKKITAKRVKAQTTLQQKNNNLKLFLMKKIFTTKLCRAVLASLALITAGTASAGDLSLSAGTQTYTYTKNELLTITPTVSGTLTVSYTPAAGTPEDQTINGPLKDLFGPRTANAIYASSDIFGLDTPIAFWSVDGDGYKATTIQQVTANKPYYMQADGAGFETNGTIQLTFTLGEGGGGSGESKVVEIPFDEPTVVKSTQTGIIREPAGLNARVTYTIQISTDSQTDISEYMNDGWETYSFIKSELTASGYVYTLTATPGLIFPVNIEQTVVDEITYTVTMIRDVLQELNLDTPTTMEAEQKFYFENTIPAGILTVKVKGDLNNERLANRMIYKDEDFQQIVYTTTQGKMGSGDTDPTAGEYPTPDDGVYTVQYVLSQTGTYYFRAPVNGEYTLSVAERSGSDTPSTEQARLTHPEAGVSAFYQFIITWNNIVLEEGSMSGIVVTNPNGETVPVKNYYLTPVAPEGSSALDGLGINFGSSDWSKLAVPGRYTIFVPQGVVWVEGQPNAQVTLYYTLNPDVSVSYFSLEEHPATYTPNPWNYQNTVTYAQIYFEDMPMYYVKAGTDRFTATVNGVEVDASLAGFYTIEVPVFMQYAEDCQEVEIVIPANVVRNQADDVNPEITVNYVLVGLNDSGKISPESGTIFVEGMERKVTVTWDGIISHNTSDLEPSYDDEGNPENNEYFYFVLQAADGTETELTVPEYVEFNDPAEPTAAIIDLSSFADGEYTLTIPLSSILVNNNDVYTVNEEIVATYILGSTNSVEGLEADENGVFQVYNLQGMKVSRDGVKDINSLSKGIYIINGKKVQVK